MFDGRLTRPVFLALILLVPLAVAAPPSQDRPAADAMDGQEITDLAIDPSGQFVASVVAFDNAKVSLLPGSSSTKDVYLCDYGAVERPTSGSGCRGLRYPSNIVVPATQPPNAPQRVDATSIDSAGRQGYFAVSGPSKWISLWKTTADTPEWVVAARDDHTSGNISIARDASRVAVGTLAASPTAEGRIEIRFGNNGTLAWFVGLQNPSGGNVRPTALDWSRTGGVLAIGTTDSLLLMDPTGERPTSSLSGITQADAVNAVQLSADGQYVAAAASNGVFLAKVQRDGSKLSVPSASVFNRGFGEAAQDVAISLDGSRFAAAAGNKIYFFHRLDTAAIAEPIGESFDAGARVTDLAYDEKGQMLVAIAGSRVMGFGPNKNTPIWSFDATKADLGGLDGPLRKVAVSDDAQRIIVAGRSKTMAYSSVIGVTASLSSTTGAQSVVPTQTLPLALTIKNAGSLSDNYTFVVSTPVGWESASAQSIRLDPDEVGTVRFNVTAPAGGDPGVYGVQVRVRSAAADEFAQRRNQASEYLAQPTFNITIPRSVVLKVEAPDDKLILRQGAEQTLAFTIRNEGNAEGVVNLSARQELTRGTSWDIRFSPGEQVRVPADSTTTVNMIITAPSDAGSGDRNIITIRAREGETVEATDQVTAYADAQFGAELATNRSTWEFFPGQVHVIRLNVTNIGNTEDTYNLTYSISPASVESDWRVTIESPQVTIQRGQTKVVGVTVKAVASDAREASITLKSISQSSPAKEENTLILSLLTVPRPPTDDEDRLLPAPGAALAVLAVALVALARRAAGGRR